MPRRAVACIDVPWCESCEAFYNPNTLRADGTCPRCGAQVGDPAAVATDVDDENVRNDDAEEEELVAKVPWHFWVGVIAMVVYLGWRFVQGIAWFF